MILDLLSLEGNKVSSDIKSYSTLLYGVPKVGKTEIVSELYGLENTLVLGFEAGYKNIPGLMGVTIDSYSTLLNYLQQLQRKEVRAKYDTIVFDTLDQFAFICEKYILDTYGKEALGECKAHGGAYKIFDIKVLNVLKKLNKMNYNIVYLSHSALKTEKDATTGQEYDKYLVKAPNRVQSIVLPEVDNIWFAYRKPTGERVLYTRESMYFQAGSRIKNLPAEIEFNAETIKRVFKECVVKGMDEKYITTDLAQQSIGEKEYNFEELMKSIKELGSELVNRNYHNECNEIIVKELGTNEDGSTRLLADCTPTQSPVLEVILMKLQELKSSIK